MDEFGGKGEERQVPPLPGHESRPEAILSEAGGVGVGEEMG